MRALRQLVVVAVILAGMFAAGSMRSLQSQVVEAFTAAAAPGGIYRVHPSLCWQDVAASVPANVGDPVGRVDDLSGAGNPLLQSTATARPILRQDGSYYYIEPDRVDDCLATSASLAFGPTSYFAVAGSKVSDSGGLFMVGTAPTNRTGLLNVGSAGRFMPYMRVATVELSQGAGVVGVWNDDVVAVVEGLITPGTSTGRVNGVQSHNFANTVTTQSVVGPLGVSHSGAAGSPTSFKRFHGGVALAADFGSANRALVREWLASLSGATLA